MIKLYKRPHNAMKGVLFALFLLVNTGTLAAPQSSANQNSDNDFSKANQLLFMTDHLHNVQTPARLQYEFVHRAGDEEGYEDRVELNIEDSHGNDNNAGKRVAVDFLSGDRHRYVPEIGDARGNPVIMMFLQNDVSTLAQRTGGSWRYFQRRVKFALEDTATVTQDTAPYEGKQVAVERIQLTPYANEQAHRDKLDAAVDRRYTFILSDAVPGGVLEIRAEVPAENGQPALLDRLTLARSTTNTDSTASTMAQ